MAQRIVTDSAWQERVLAETEVGHLAFVDGDAPYVVPISFVFDGGHVYCHSSLDGHKMDLVRTQPKVSFVAYVVDRTVIGSKACSFGVRYRSVMARGVAREVTDPERKVRVLNQLAAKAAAGRPFEPATLADAATVAVIGIELSDMVGKENA